ncbi:right-handed parallel beta-helix repeat-containing protein [Parabacteroides sp. TM07-1AC]|jgi:hypothetical protein|uniref:right-handed parallel beta-helix repeat-containing protein n=1 Tax=Parabacteroides sp. TM07-1AC TaxID=2292363 RepID=UPI000F008666|nr:right-handed parallel beta-helix repeat-containing protein [Parabacteroides sp. TM07-1AC]RHU29275.1 right-handed parallel beta-helix repeat-containing protein [Parabacteroides sp. TM07-1AC]
MKKVLCLISIFSLCGNLLFAREYHVSVKGSDANNGDVSSPFKTINWAAQKALPGDTVTVHDGTYREWVNPLNGGEREGKRILYRVAKGEKAEIKGSELVTGWKKEKKGKGVWKVILPNIFFGNYNPYNDKIFGDWFSNHGRDHHTGDVYLNDVSLYETTSVEKVIAPDTMRTIRDPQGATNVWFAEVDADKTTIYANFGDADPNKETVEIAVRPTCFYPTREGLDYITIRGFHVSQAATQWAAPTAEQVGMIATHWCKGWIIEDNVIKNSRCNGITLGKERGSGHNLECNDKRLDGTAHYIEVIFNTLRRGWAKDNVGSHIVRNNIISDCEQTGICGSMGAAFSEISGNHIYNIHVKGQFSGAEMAGIKLHGAIDTYIHHNRIHKIGNFGIWMDWMAQGMRISSNLLYDNKEPDLFFEVDHGPYIVDNNILLSRRSLFDDTDGGAFLHNLFGGYINRQDDMRYTPYHLNHSTEVKGITTITNGDHRFYNNLFVGGKVPDAQYGLCMYDPAKGPVYAEDNLFCNGAKPMTDRNQGSVMDSYDPDLKLEETADGVYLSFKMGQISPALMQVKTVDSARLGITKLSGLPYEHFDGTPFILDKDYFGVARSGQSPVIGPVETLQGGTIRMKVW